MSVKQVYRAVAGQWVASGRAPISPVVAFTYGTTKPDASNTGCQIAQGSLTTVNGDITVTVAGTEITGKYVIGRIRVQAANVWIHDNIVIGNGYSVGDTALVDCNSPSCVNALIEFNTLNQVPATGNVYHNAVIGHDYTAQRNNISAVIDAFGVYNNNAGYQTGPTNVIIRGNYVKDLSYFSPDPNHGDNRSHNDGVQIQGGTGCQIYGNTFNAIVSTTVGTAGGGPATDPYVPSITGHVITLTPVVSAITGTDCHNNWIYSGYGGIIVVSNVGAHPSNAGNFYDNRLHGAWQATSVQCDNNMTGTTFTGNVDDNSSAAINVVYYTPGTL